MFSFSLCLKWMKDNKRICIHFIFQISFIKTCNIFPERCFHFDRIWKNISIGKLLKYKNIWDVVSRSCALSTSPCQRRSLGDLPFSHDPVSFQDPPRWRNIRCATSDRIRGHSKERSFFFLRRMMSQEFPQSSCATISSDIWRAYFSRSSFGKSGLLEENTILQKVVAKI